MLSLGISDSHDASAVLISDGKILAAVSEERFTRRKRQQGFPVYSLQYLKGFIAGKTVDRVYVAGRYGRAFFRVMDYFYSRTNPKKNICAASSKLASLLENGIAHAPLIRTVESRLGALAVKSKLKMLGIKYRSLSFIDHHYSHLVSALTGMDSTDYLSVSLDAYGDGRCGLIIKVRDNTVKEILEISPAHSIANFYASICAYLGFKEGEEGKVMALADYGKEIELSRTFAELFTLSSGSFKINSKYKTRAFLKELKGHKKEDIALALQKTTERVVILLLEQVTDKKDTLDLFLAGGFFANIKVNQRLHESGLFGRIFVFPHMGDGGICFACSIDPSVPKDYIGSLSYINRIKTVKLKSAYLGPDYPDEYIRNALNKSGLIYKQETDIEKSIARLLAEGKSVARFYGRMEYGPRALGNRSILYQTTDKSVNDWLNRKLGRPAYMPFAPVTLSEFKDTCYLGVNGAGEAARFMTVSFNCTEEMKRISPAVVHVDGTARPQLLKEEDNPSCYRILREYYNMTGIPSLINTSFNMHEEPIVCSPEDAICAYKSAQLDYLAINKFLTRINDKDCAG